VVEAGRVVLLAQARAPADFPGDYLSWLVDSGHWWGDAGILNRVQEHVVMSLLAVGLAALVAQPVALVMGHTGRGGPLTILISNIGRAVPSFAILVIAAQALGIGARPAFVALVLLGIPPMVTNTYVAVRGVDPEVRESAVGMGLSGRQVLWRVELPMGTPLIMAGLRTSAVQVVATATLAAIVGWGGLGRFIVDGLATRDFPEVFGGAVLVAGLSLGTEYGLGAVQHAVTPRGLRAGEAPPVPSPGDGPRATVPRELVDEALNPRPR
jgi:osmoprotectant transport system permease protein